ncbi:lipopolysaccharide biosynthesis protein [Clostridium brassicae]|uniref:Oligosaccharide flippase family protein n=1 Tax=Clostridium brassicae TaxID=2999072 RepID=A0ABT4D8M1_9CLOT|nr:oligosaccharide flippase family protein [Clostridium brassicae]MCY6958625.1 oligosaccharide flippase family protein [Clostridium brassicae]
MIKAITQKLSKSKLIKGGIWYTIGNLFLQGVSFFTVPIFLKVLKLTTEEFGIINTYTTWLAVFTSIVSLGLVASVSRGKYDFEEKYDDFLSSIMLLSTLCFGVFIALTLIFQNFISNIIELTPTLVKLLILQSFCAFIIDFCNTKFTIEYKYKKYLFVSITSTLLNVILSIVFISYMTVNRHMGRIIAGALITLIYGIVLYFSIIRKGKFSVKKEYWKYALAISLPLIPHSLSGIILSQFDRIMIQKMVGSSATGIYSFAYSIGMILSVVWTALNKAWVPYFFESMKQNKYEDIREKCKYYIGIFSLITFVLIFVSPEVGKLMGSKDFWVGLDLVPVVMAGYFFVFLYSLPSNLEFYAKKTHLISIGTFGAGFLNIFLNVIFIRKYGYGAAAWTTLVSYVALFIFHYVIAAKISENKIFELKYFIYSTIFVSISGYVFYIIKDNWLMRYGCVLLVMFVLAYIIQKKLKIKFKS